MSKRLIENIYPLSPVQAGMLFHTLFAPHSGVYFQQRSCRLDGGLDVEAFAAYEALSRGAAPDWKECRPFADYIAWLQRQDLAQSEAFWRRSLEGFNAPTPLPAALPAPRPGEGFDARARHLGAAATAALN